MKTDSKQTQSRLGDELAFSGVAESEAGGVPVRATPDETPVTGRIISVELERQRQEAEENARIAAEAAAKAKAAAEAAEARVKARAEAEAKAKAKVAAEAAAIVEETYAKIRAQAAAAEAAEKAALTAALTAVREGPKEAAQSGAMDGDAKQSEAAEPAQEPQADNDVLELVSEMKAEGPSAADAAAASAQRQKEKRNMNQPTDTPKSASGDAEPETAATDLIPIAQFALTKEAPEAPPPLAAAQLEPILKGAAAGAPVRLETLSNQRITLRVTASIWARPEIVAERRTGCAPLGPVVDSAEAAAAALAPLADDELSRGRGLQSLSERLGEDPWAAMGGLQGDGVGPLLAETRSVVTRCPDCAGAGGFSCIDCEGVGRRDCTPCRGTGMVEEGCPSCRRAASGLDEGKVSLDPKRAASFLMAQISSGGAAGEPAERSVATSSDTVAGRRDCPECAGSGSNNVECANCAGAGERRCQSCSGSGRVTCAPCAGTGFLTEIFSGRARYERSLHIALSTGEADVSAPNGATEAIRSAWDSMVEKRVFAPRLVSFQSSGFAAQAVFEAEISLSRLRAIIGARAPRTQMEFWSAGDPPMLLDPPKALDLLHRKAVDSARLSTREGRRQVASALSDLSCGRAALRAAARRERDLPVGAFGPLASDAENARLLDLARASHGSVGWREERHVWTVTALLGAPAGWLAAQGLSEPAGAAVRPIAVAFAPSQAQAAPGVWETLGAVWSLLVATTPFITLWLLAGLAAAWVYRRTTLRTLGFTRSRSAMRVFLGSTPLLALGAALFGYGVGLTIGAPPPKAAKPGEALQVQAAAVAEKPAVRIAEAPPKQKVEAKVKASAPDAVNNDTGSNITVTAFGGGAELASFAALNPVDWEWRGDGSRGAIVEDSGKATLVARCEARAIVFRLENAPVSAAEGGASHVEVAWSTERARLQARQVAFKADPRGVVAPEWRASFPAIRALRRDRNLSVDWSINGSNGKSDFRLIGSADVLQRILNSC